MAEVGVLEAPAQSGAFQKTAMAYVELTKPRIMVLLLYTGICGMLVGMHGIPTVETVLATMLGLALSTGGSAAFNMWYDRDIDQVMKRTAHRPIPAGLVAPERALAFSLTLMVASFFELYFWVNPLAAWLAFAGAFYYAIVYTVWLKRRTWQNIVIGGGAGAFPPLIGAAAASGHVGVPAVLLFCIVFFWTPPHFWSLAVYRNDEYRRANIPMLPVVRGAKHAKLQSLAYGGVLLVASLAMPWVTPLSWVYFPIAIALNAGFIHLLFESWREPDGSFVYAKRSFFFSILYLFILFFALAVTSLI